MKQDWEIKDFEDCIEKIVYTNKIQRKDFLENGKYPIVSQEQDFINGYWNNSDDLFEVKKPIVIFGDHTQVLKYVDFDFVLGADGVKILQPKKEIEPRFFYYYLQKINLGSLGYARHYRLLKEIEIHYPKSLPLQKRIVAVLDEAFTAIARAKANAEQNLRNAKEFFESYLESAFANKGDGWGEKRIQDIAKVVNGYSFDSKDFSSKNSIKSVKITNVGVKEFIEETDNYLPGKFKDTLQEFQVKIGNIVIALTRTIIAAGLKVAVVPKSYDGALLNQRVAALIPNDKLINQRFLYNFLCTDTVAKYVMANVNTLMQPNLSINDLKNLLVPCPPISEQQTIVQKLDALSAETKKLEVIYKQKLNDLEELKKSILQKAFSGELKTIEAATV